MISSDPNVVHFVNSNKHIVIRYPDFAGGNFMQCLLGYFDKVINGLPGRILLPENFTDNGCKIEFDTLQQIRHHHVMRTIPPIHLRENWVFFEGACMFDMPWSMKVHNRITDKPITPFTLSRANTSYLDIIKHYHVTHLVHECSYNGITRILPNATIINLIEFYDLFMKSNFKSEYDINMNDYNPLSEISGDNVIQFKMNNIFNKNLFLSEVSALMETIIGPCKYHPLLEEYYDAYINVHQ